MISIDMRGLDRIRLFSGLDDGLESANEYL
jgi:hypothetical protein